MPRIEVHMSSQPRTTRASQVAFFTKVIGGVNLHVLSAILLGGQTVSSTQIVAVFQAFLQATTDLETAKVAYQQKLAAQQAALTSANTMAALLKAYAQGAYGKQNPIMADFGFSVAKATVKSVKVKAAAAVKSAATRVARNTMGPKAKEAIHGTVPATAPTVATPATPVVTTPAK
jgi:collagenase-like PrtC family protease